MADLKSLTRQHREILNLIDLIGKYMTEEKLNHQGVRGVRKQIATLAGILKIHMIKEDKFLYPKLLTKSEPQVQIVAKEFIDQMGDLADQFEKYYQNYLDQRAIIEHPNDFIQDTLEILKRLKERIEREEKELYILLS